MCGGTTLGRAELWSDSILLSSGVWLRLTRSVARTACGLSRRATGARSGAAARCGSARCAHAVYTQHPARGWCHMATRSEAGLRWSSRT